MGSDEFNLRALVRDVVATSPTPDLNIITARVLDNIAVDQQPAALRQCMRQFVRQVVSEQRMGLTIADRKPGGARPVPTPRRSGKVEMIQAWRQQLRQIVYVGGQEKFLGDCTRDDLIFAADQRRKNAAQNNAKARQYEIFVGLLNEHNAATVGGLPEAVLRGALDVAA